MNRSKSEECRGTLRPPQQGLSAAHLFAKASDAQQTQHRLEMAPPRLRTRGPAAGRYDRLEANKTALCQLPTVATAGLSAMSRRFGWLLRTTGVALLWTSVSVGQSTSLDAVDAPSAPSGAPGAAPDKSSPEGSAPPAPEQPAQPIYTWPKAISTVASYPAGGSGDHEIELELSIDAEGRVTEARALSGQPPFSVHAEKIAKQWLFVAATRNGASVPAKVRFQVRFDEPEPVEACPEAPGASDQRDATAGQDCAPLEAAAPPLQPQERPKRTEPKTIEVTVQGEHTPLRTRLGSAEVREIPGAFGDPFRAIEILPGVVPIASGVPYFYVRGAPPGNVGYYFDGIPVPILYHFAAGPGVIHPALVENVDLYAGAYPARYGRVAGGLVVGEMSSPRYQWRGEASVRLVDSGAMLEAPFAGGRGSIMLGGRYSYTALVLSLIVPEVTLDYWDYQARARYAIDHDDSVEVLLFGSRDLLQYEETDYAYGDGTTEPVETTRTIDIANLTFHRVDLRWDHDLPSGRWRNALMLGLDRTGIADGELVLEDRMIGLRSEFERTVEPGVRVRSGADILFENITQRLANGSVDGSGDGGDEPAPDTSNPNTTIRPDPTQPQTGPSENPQAGPAEEGSAAQSNDAEALGFDRARNDFVIGAHLDVVLDVTPGIEVTPGLRSDLFVSGRSVALAVDPRISARYRITDRLTLIHGLGLAHQLPSFVIPIPGAKPSLSGGLQRSVQHTAGAEYELFADIQSSFVLFHNLFFNMTDMLGIAQLNQTYDNGEGVFVRMMGQAYGAEVMLRRSLTRRLGGFISYTLSHSRRVYGRLEGPATTDRTHVLNLALSYSLGRNWRLGNRLLLYSGVPARVAYLAAARNPPRAPPFWRLDWRLQKRWPTASGGYWGFVAEVLNTTLNKETLDRSCSAYDCADESIGPVTIPSIGVEAAF